MNMLNGGMQIYRLLPCHSCQPESHITSIQILSNGLFDSPMDYSIMGTRTVSFFLLGRRSITEPSKRQNCVSPEENKNAHTQDYMHNFS